MIVLLATTVYIGPFNVAFYCSNVGCGLLFSCMINPVFWMLNYFKRVKWSITRYCVREKVRDVLENSGQQILVFSFCIGSLALSFRFSSFHLDGESKQLLEQPNSESFSKSRASFGVLKDQCHLDDGYLLS